MLVARAFLFLGLSIGAFADFARAEASGKPLRIGLAAFGLQHRSFPCRAAMQILRSGFEPHIAFLWGSFGRSMVCPRRIANNPNLRRIGTQVAFLVHGSNETCKPRRCQLGEGLYSRTEYRARARAVRKSLTPIFEAGSRVIISLGLESRWSYRRAKMISEIYFKEFKDAPVEFSYNPIGGFHGPLPGVAFVELHNPRRICKAGEIFVNDGFDIDFSHRRSRFENNLTIRELRKLFERNQRSGCSLQFAWAGVFQGRASERQFSFPRVRSFGISDSDVLELKKLVRD